jgi:hypothetical protein
MHKPEFEGLGRVACYAAILYSGDKKSANVEVRCRQHSSITAVKYNFNGQGFQDSNTYKVDSNFQ